MYYYTYGKIHEYYPNISHQAYFRFFLKSIIDNHFEGSVVSFVSFFTGEEGIELGELEEIKLLILQIFTKKCKPKFVLVVINE